MGQELETGYSARRMYEYLSDSQISSLARQADRNGLQQELINSPELSFDWHSQMIGKVMHHPILGGMLGLVNPFLATLAHRPNRMPNRLLDRGRYDQQLCRPPGINQGITRQRTNEQGIN